MSLTNGTNGTPPDTLERYREVRRRNRLLQEEIRSVALEKLHQRTCKPGDSEVTALRRRLQESAGWEWVGAYDEAFDRLTGPDRDMLQPVSLYQDRRYGANWPFWRTWLEHARIRAGGRLICTQGTLAPGALKGLTNYVVGEGFTDRAVAKREETPKELVDCVQEALDEFRQHNQWNLQQRELFVMSRRDGEYFLRFVPDDEGMLEIDQILPEQIMEPNNNDPPTTSFGCINEPGRLEKITGYNLCLDGDQSQGFIAPAEEIIHTKINVDRMVKRGLSDFSFDTYDTLKGAQRLLDNLSAGTSIQASIALIRQHEQSVQAEVQGFVSANSDFVEPGPLGNYPSGTSGYSGGVARYAPGRIEDIPKGYNYIAPPFATNAQNFIAVEQAVLRAVAVRWNAPEWLVSGDASNNSYASSITAESPFVKSCKGEQAFYHYGFHRTAREAVKVRCDAGRLRCMGRSWSWDEVDRMVEIKTEPPTIEVRNKLQEAQRNQVAIQAGAFSPQMWCQEENVDYEQVVKDLEEHKQVAGDQGPGLPGMGGGGDEGGGGGGGGGGASPPMTGGEPPPAQPGSGLATALGEDVAPDGDCWRELLEAHLLEAGFTGEKQSKSGARLCYQDGKRVPCPKAAKPAKPAKPTVDEMHQAIQGFIAKGVPATPAQKTALADAFATLTGPQLTELKKRLGVKASGAKLELAKKIAEKALAVLIPKPPPPPPPPPKPTVDGAHDLIKQMLAAGKTDPAAVKELAGNLVKLTGAQLTELKKRLGFKGTGNKADLAKKIAGKALAAAPAPAPAPPAPPTPAPAGTSTILMPILAPGAPVPPGFTGIAGTGHKYLNGQQVMIGSMDLLGLKSLVAFQLQRLGLKPGNAGPHGILTILQNNRSVNPLVQASDVADALDDLKSTGFVPPPPFPAPPPPTPAGAGGPPAPKGTGTPTWPPMRLGAGAAQPPGFTGIDANGHHWINGKQVSLNTTEAVDIYFKVADILRNGQHLTGEQKFELSSALTKLSVNLIGNLYQDLGGGSVKGLTKGKVKAAITKLLDSTPTKAPPVPPKGAPTSLPPVIPPGPLPRPLGAGSKVIGGAPKLADTVLMQEETTWEVGKPQTGQVLNGVPFESAPPKFWEKVKDVAGIEPQAIKSIKRAGILIQEPDGRVWICQPTNNYGKRKHTWPGGGVEPGLTDQQNALKEVWEETGLQVEITGYAGDFEDSNNGNNGRMFIGRRIGGAPWDAKIEKQIISNKTGKPAAESESVMLVTPEKAAQLLHRTDDLAQLMVAHPIPISMPTRDSGSEPLKKFVNALAPAADAYKKEKQAKGEYAGNAEMHVVQEMRGFNKKPKVVASKDMDALLAKGDHIEVMRGMTDIAGGPTGKQMAEQYRSGDHFSGHGIFGSGTYADSNKGGANMAAQYAFGSRGFGAASGSANGAMIRMALPKDARIIKASELQKFVPTNPEAFKKYPQGKEAQECWLGVQAALAGYDAIHVDGPTPWHGSYGIGFYSILNRGIVTVQDTDPGRGHIVK